VCVRVTLVQWLNAQTDRVGFCCEVYHRGQLLCSRLGFRIRRRKKRLPPQVDRWTSKIFGSRYATVGHLGSLYALLVFPVYFFGFVLSMVVSSNLWVKCSSLPGEIRRRNDCHVLRRSLTPSVSGCQRISHLCDKRQVLPTRGVSGETIRPADKLKVTSQPRL